MMPGLKNTLKLLVLAALLGTCALLLVEARSLSWDTVRLADKEVFGAANLYIMAGLPVALWIWRRLAGRVELLSIGLASAATFAIMAPEGRFACIIALAYAGAVALEPFLDRITGRPLRAGPWIAFAAFTAVGAGASLYRHQAFGSGAWDVGCFSHSSWLASKLLPLQSTVLHADGVHVLGDHFYPVILLLAPLHWLGLGAKGLLVLQAAAVGAVAFPFHRFVSRRVDCPWLALVLTIVLLFSFGFQSAVYFDFHAQTLALWPLAEAVERLDRGRYRAMLPWLALVWICKESMPLYVAAFGAYMLLFEAQARRMGAALMVGGVAGLLVTVGLIQPRLLAGGPQGMIHAANYAAFGDSLPKAVLGMIANPMRTMAVAISPIEKRMALMSTTVGAGLIALLKPRYLVLAAPTLVERFLSSKQQMWEMGYHYAAPLTLFVAFAAIDALPRLRELLPGPIANARVAAMALLLALLTNAYGYRHASNFLVWEHGYFLPKTERVAARRMVAAVPDGASIEAMNHVLAHLADRKDARFLRRKPQAEALAFALAQDDWIPGRGNRRASSYRSLIKGLMAGDEYRLAFSEGLSVLLLKGPGPAVKPSPELQAFMEKKR